MVDNDEKLYEKMLRTPAFLKPVSSSEEISRFDKFLVGIIEEGSIQRSRVYWNKIFEKEAYYGRKKTTKLIRYAKKIKPITRLVFASNIGKKVKNIILWPLIKVRFKKAYK